MKNEIKKIQTCFAVCSFSSPEYAQFWVFSGTCVSLATSHCRSVGFWIDVVSYQETDRCHGEQLC